MLKKLLVALVASAFALGAYAQAPKSDTKTDAKGEESEENEMGMHPKIRPGLYPFETGIGKMKLRRDVKFAHPTFRREPNHGGAHEQAKQEAECRE